MLMSILIIVNFFLVNTLNVIIRCGVLEKRSVE